jgi:hypothetical protein
MASIYTNPIILLTISVRKIIVAISIWSKYSNVVVYPTELISGMYIDENAPPKVEVKVKVMVKVTVAIICPNWLVMYEIATDLIVDLKIFPPTFPISSPTSPISFPTTCRNFGAARPIFWHFADNSEPGGGRLIERVV